MMLRTSRLWLLAALACVLGNPVQAQSPVTMRDYVTGLTAAGSLVGTERLLALQAGGMVTITPYQILAKVANDCSMVSPPSIICTKTNGVPFAASATTDTTDAGNISKGVLSASRGGAGGTNGALKADGSGNVSHAACGDLSDAAASCNNDTTDAGNISKGTLNALRLPSPFTSGTRSGTTSKFATVSGSFTAGHLAAVNTNGDLVDGGAAGAGTLTENKLVAGAGLTTAGNCDNTSTNASSPCQPRIIGGQVPGTATNDNATAGNVGEILSCSNTVGGMTSSVPFNFCTITLTPGDWQVSSTTTLAGSNWSVQAVQGSISQTSATINSTLGLTNLIDFGSPTPMFNLTLPTAPFRFSVATGTTLQLWLVGKVGWSSGSGSMSGLMQAIRAR